MEFIKPAVGLFFWLSIIFVLLFLVLRRFAWPKILEAIEKREAFIKASLQRAEQVEQEAKAVQEENKVILAQANKERQKILEEARKTAENLLQNAEKKAKEEVDRKIADAEVRIAKERENMLNSLKDELKGLLVKLSEKVLRKELSKGNEQDEFVARLLKDLD